MSNKYQLSIEILSEEADKRKYGSESREEIEAAIKLLEQFEVQDE